MSEQYYTFTSGGATSLPKRWSAKGRASQIILGKEGQTFPSSVKIQQVTQDNGVSTLREFTAAPTNRSILVETPANAAIDITATVSADFYVEMNDLAEA